jgi:radical SAM-linked protein
VCDFKVVKNRVYELGDYVKAPPPPARPPESPLRTRVRIRYAKLGRLVALSHLETMHALLRAFRRAALPMAFSQGYHPKPKISYGPALSVGIESRAELLDLELVGPVDAQAISVRLQGALPEGLALLSVSELEPGAPSIGETIRAVHYVAEFPAETWDEATLSECVEAFLGSEQALIQRVKAPKNKDRRRHQKIAPGKQREINLKEIVTHIGLEGPNRVAFSLRAEQSGSARPAEVLGAVFGEAGVPPLGVKVLKEGVSLARIEREVPSGQPRAPRYLDA